MSLEDFPGMQWDSAYYSCLHIVLFAYCLYTNIYIRILGKKIETSVGVFPFTLDKSQKPAHQTDKLYT